MERQLAGDPEPIDEVAGAQRQASEAMTTAEPGDVTVTRDDAGSVYALEKDGHRIGGAFFHAEGSVLTFTHTEVSDEFAGQHLGALLVEAALDDVRERGETVIARCPFVASYIGRHPQYADLLAAD